MNQFLLEYNVEHFVNKNKNDLEPILKDDFEKLLQHKKQDIMSNSSKDSADNISTILKK